MKLSKYAIAILVISTPMILAEENTTSATEMPEVSTTRTADKPTAGGERETGSIAQVINDNPDFSLLTKAIEAADLKEALSEKTVRTVFAPNDAAFKKLPEGVLGKLLMPENKDKLRTLLMHHVVNGDVLTMSLRDATEVKSMGGEKLDIHFDDDTTKEVGDAKIVDTILTDTNGVILATDQVLVPESLEDFTDGKE